MSALRALLAGDGDSERGAAAVEFALILPILVLLLLGIVEFGRAYHAQVTVTHAAREAVRVHALSSGDPVAIGQAAATTLNPVTVSTTACVPGEPTTATVAHNFDFIVPMFGANLTLTGVGEMRCGG